jgi:uncharacterized protein YfbU (UPF0304 family)
MDIKLTDAERLILSNQYRIMALLDRSERDGWEQLSEQLRDGHAYFYENHLKMTMRPNLEEADTNFVLRVLGIYSDMAASYQALEEKGDIKEHDVRFPGFDGNDSYEAVLLQFTEALRKDRRFSETLPEGRDLNSHFPAARGYRRIVATWEQMGGPQYLLDKAQIEELLLVRRT